MSEKPRIYYDSMEQAAAALDIPKAMLQRAKRAGCKAFRGSRVYAEDLRGYFEANSISNDPNDKRALECQFLIEKINALKFENEKEQGKYILNSTWEEWQVRKAEQLKSDMAEVFKRQLPPKLEGLRAPEIAAKMDEAIAEFVLRFREEAPEKE